MADVDYISKNQGKLMSALFSEEVQAVEQVGTIAEQRAYMH